MSRIVEHYRGQGMSFDTLIHWSDGCKAQFKSCDYFYGFLKYRMDYGINMVVLNFFATAHGKGMADGVAAVCKSTIIMKLMSCDGMATLRDAASIHAWCLQHLQHPKKARHVWASKRATVVQSRFVHHLASVQELEAARAKRQYSMTVPGTMGIHQLFIRGLGTTVSHRTLSCLCGQCIAGNWDRCKIRSTIVAPTAYVMVEANQAALAVARRVQRTVLSLDTITNGEFIAVRVEEDGVAFKLMRVVHTWRKLFSGAKDNDGNSFSRGSIMLRGQYLLEKQRPVGARGIGASQSSWYCLRKKTIFVKRDWVVCRRVRLTLRDVHSREGQTWTLPSGEANRIRDHMT